jgi:sec-independent protein translocase protein TatA
MFGIGQTELIILALVLVLLFGSTKLPSLMRNLGRSATEFKKGMRDEPADDSGDRPEKHKEEINT